MGFRALAVLSHRYPAIIIVMWVLFLGFCGINAHKLPGVLKDHGLTPAGAYEQVRQILESEFRIPGDPVLLVFEKRETVREAEFKRYIMRTLQDLQGVEGLLTVRSPHEEPGMVRGNLAYALLSIDSKRYDTAAILEDIQQRLPVDGNMLVRVTGNAAIQADVNRASLHDMKQAEMAGIPVAFLILLFAFGGVAAAAIPVIAGVIAVTGSMGIMVLIGERIDLSNFVLNVIPMVGLALSLDFALMLVSRFREELRCMEAEEALIATMQTAGRAVLYSALTVFFGLLGIFFIPLPMFASVALGAITALTVSALTALTLVPALLAVWWPAMKGKIRASSGGKGRSKIWLAWSSYVMSRPIRLGALAAIFLMGCLLPLSGMRLAVPGADSLPTDYASRLAFDVYRDHFIPPETSTVYIVGGKALGREKTSNLARTLVPALIMDPLVLRVEPVQGRQLLIQVMLAGKPDSHEVMSWVRAWEKRGTDAAAPFLLGGEAKFQQEVYDAIFDHFPQVFLFILVSNFIVLFIAFRSVLIPLKTIAMNLLSLGASFGLLALIFSSGQPGMDDGSIAIMIPVFIFGLAFGISMDYGVFLVSRIDELFRKTGDNDQAVMQGLSATSGIITSAAAIMVAVTLPFAFGEVAGVRQLGIGIAAAIIIDATVIRLVLVPSLMKLLGKWNWWAPRWLK
ncbi:MMPL family transporter [Paenibacillus nasutitermitis]|uniref:Membrane protein n=1 Tax=Paenibacillus nasutitermitis TaxID=1652958 RepID=A0A916YR59_9BACL|nr:efflux RND transporter permease subunit [Paenibacillus nasutitermitis]GGD57429.1 membrane protein [Paenibacillus nasutitermitis]